MPFMSVKETRQVRAEGTGTLYRRRRTKGEYAD
jgi:hypothetical protein